MKCKKIILKAILCAVVFFAASFLLFKMLGNSVLTAEKIAAITTPTIEAE